MTIRELTAQLNSAMNINQNYLGKGWYTIARNHWKNKVLPLMLKLNKLTNKN